MFTRETGHSYEVYDAEGHCVTDDKGEQVCTQAFQYQPVYFWVDVSGEKYHNAYFTRYKNIGRHGEYVSITNNGGIVIYGRLDATLNSGVYRDRRDI